MEGISNSIGRLTPGLRGRLLLPVSALGKILLYFVTVLVVSALLAPLLYFGLHEHVHFAFHRYLSRTTQVTALVLLVPLLLWLRLRVWDLKEFGLEKNRHAVRDWAMGLSLAVGPLAVLAVGYVACSVYRVNQDQPWGAFVQILLTAAFVPVVEEFLFRGILLGLARKALGAWPAAVGVSLLFAFVHFLKPSKLDAQVVTWSSGFALYGHTFDDAPSLVLFFAGFISLFAAGLILALAAMKTRSLWLPIGIHAGWIFGQQMFQKIAKFGIKPPEKLLPWVGPNVVSGAVPTGIVPLLVLAITALGVWLYVRNRTASTGRA